MKQLTIYNLNLTNEQMMEILGVSYPTLVRWRKKGMPYFQEGTSIRYKLSDVEDWLNQEGATTKTETKTTFK